MLRVWTDLLDGVVPSKMDREQLTHDEEESASFVPAGFHSTPQGDGQSTDGSVLELLETLGLRFRQSIRSNTLQVSLSGRTV